MSVPGPSDACVVVALDSSVREEVLELAQHAAGRAAARLLGLFIEDEELLAHAGSRLAREILLGGGERPLETTALQRQLRAESAAARRLFESAAARRGLAYTFEVARGEPVAELLRRAAAAEVVVVSVDAGARSRLWRQRAIRELAHSAPRMLLIARRAPFRVRNIMAVVEDPGTAPRILTAAAPLAEASRRPLLVLLFGSARAERQRLESELGAYGESLILLDSLADAPEPTVLARAARSREVRVLVASAEALSAEEELFRGVLAAAPSSLLLVRSR